MSYLFCGHSSSWLAQYGCNAVKASCSPDLSRWNVSSVTSMSYMFSGASSFTSDLSAWDVSSVTSMDGMFYDASGFTSCHKALIASAQRGRNARTACGRTAMSKQPLLPSNCRELCKCNVVSAALS